MAVFVDSLSPNYETASIGAHLHEIHLSELRGGALMGGWEQSQEEVTSHFIYSFKC